MPVLDSIVSRCLLAAARKCAALPRQCFARQPFVVTVVSAMLSSCACGKGPEVLFSVKSLAFPTITVSRDGQRIAIGGRKTGEGAGIQIYDSTNWMLLNELTPTGDSVKAAVFSSDGKLLFGAIGKEILVWQLPSGKEVGRLSRHAQDVFSLALSGDGSQLISAGEDGRIIVWNAQARTHLDDFKPQDGWVRDLDIHSNTGSLAAAGDKGLFRVWKRGDPGSAVDVKHDAGESLSSVCHSLDGNWIAATGESGKIAIAELANLNRSKVYPMGRLTGDIAWLSDGRTLAVGTNRAVALLDRVTGEITERLHPFESLVYSVEYDEINDRLMVGSFRGEVKVWDSAELLKGQ